ncbi:hypothetical protein EHP00_39 [Ecytonucleospora hepatopenaei]|uniref:Uncharacterized protein n=1 Tax=Ecytonucleospora hepatopenaei TaxID=646526 RepID=A0A1W0E5K6_9MICR|nr:hypothetical protein EHP00_39 [Ecytonucleospora hepatopenaei]
MILKKQLESIKSKKKTFLRVKKAKIFFIEDEDLDVSTILERIDLKHKFFSKKSLKFDRHTLSKNEENVFNSSMQKFLYTLQPIMKKHDISYILEYLVRIYNIDTYNIHELLFLILPYSKYEDQIEKLTYKYSFHIKSYNICSLSRFFTYNSKNFRMFVKYFDFYQENEKFLLQILDEISKILCNSKTNYMGEFLIIFKKLIIYNRQSVIENTYKNMKKYFVSSEFIKEYNNLF